MRRGYALTREDQIKTYLIAHELIEQYGDEVTIVIDAQINNQQALGDVERVDAWLHIKEAAVETLEASARRLH